MSAPAPSAFSPAAIATAEKLGFKMGRANLEVFADAVLELATEDRQIVIVTSDSRGSGKLGPFGQALPKQLVEVGIAEQNLVGIAAGLSAAGKKAFAVSPACFLTARALEQIKNDVCYSDVPAVIVGISAGVSYGALGSTHHSLHDLAALRAIHNITVIVPADNFETREAVRSAARAEHPMYLRFGKAPMYDVQGPDASFKVGKATLLRDGADVAFIATGETVVHAVLAAAQLVELGLECRVLSMHTVKPLDTEAIIQAGRECRTIVTAEEHSVHGGLGEACAAVLMQARCTVPFRIVGLPDEDTVTGSQADIFRHYGTSMEGLAHTALGLLQGAPGRISGPRTVNHGDMMSYILAIDQSTSATKAVLFDAAGRVVDRESRDHRQIYRQPGWVEHDAEEIWQNTLSVLREIALRNPDKLAEAIGLAITNQRETVVVFDRRSGRPLHNAIVWQCRRGDAICQELSDAGHSETVRSKTGLRLDTYFSASKLKWLLSAQPEIRRQLEDGAALIGTIDTYLIYRLTGCEVFATDPTNASRTLLYDIRRLRWDEQLCSLFDVPMRSLAEVREGFAQFGETDAAGTLPKRFRICGVMGDSQASLFAQCCYEPGMAKATFGSGTSVLLNTGDRFETSERGAVSALAWVLQSRPTYAMEGLINYSSATIAWLKDQLGLFGDAAETAPLARAVDDNGGVYLVPAFSGLSAPHWCQEARAAIVGMTAYTRKEHIVRAALEAIAYQIRDVLEMMQSDSGIKPDVLYADGGPTQNEFLMQFTADITGMELMVAEAAESSARGVAMAAMLGQGKVDSLAQLATLSRDTRTYRPEMNADKVAHFYSGWQRAIQRVL